MQAMQFIRVYEHTVKNFIYPQCVVQFYAHKKTATARGDCGFFCFLLGLFQMVEHLAVSAVLVFP